MRLPFSARTVAVFLGGILLVPAAGTVSAQTLTWGAGGAGGSGQWDEGTTADWYNGTSNVFWKDGDAAVFAGTAGTVSIYGAVTASQVTFGTAGYTLQNFFLEGTSNGLTVETDADTTISSSIFGAGGTNPAGFTKTGTGLLLLNGGGAPVFFGAVTVANGEMRYGTASLNSTMPFVLGNTPAAALTFASTIGAVGSLSGGGTAGGVVRPSATSGSSILSIYGVGDATYAGTLAGNGNATLSLSKGGSSTQTLINASPSLTGAVTVSAGTLALSGPNGALTGISGIILNGGTFQLDNGASVNPARLASGMPVTLNGGTLSFVGNAAAQNASQTFGALNVARGASTVSVTTAGSGTAQLTASSLARTSGATVSFSDGGHVTLTGVANVNGILGGYATVGADWASLNAANGVVAYAGYASDTTTASTTDNLRITSAGGTTTSLANVQIRNSLNLVNTGGTTVTVDLGANNSLALTSGGLLSTGPAVIQSGLLGSQTGELIVTNQSALTISSTIKSTLTKSGAGTLVLAGSNTYTGATTVNQGTVQVSADANLGTGSAVVLNGGTLQASGSFSSTKSLQGTGGTVNTAGNNVTVDSAGSTASFTKTGAGILTVTRENGAVTVNGGTLRLTTLVGGNSTAVTLLNGRLEAGANGLQSVTTLGGPVVLSPGQAGQADTFIVSSLTILTPTTVDFDLGGTAQSDLLSVGSNLSLSTGAGAQLLFHFNSLGNLQTGTAYEVATLPSIQSGQFNVGEFGFDSGSTAAGYKGTFSLVNNTLNVTFSAVPEPSVNAACLCGVLGAWGARTWRRRRAARA